MSVNKVILVGNLGKDPDLRYTASGTAVCSFSVATAERFKDGQGQAKDKTEWHNVVAWRQLGEICGKYLHKGKQVYIEGKIQARSYDDKDGNKRYITEIVADQMQMLGGRGDEGGGQRDGGYAPRGGNRQESRPAQQAQRSTPATPAYEDFADPPFNPDDDIPF